MKIKVKVFFHWNKVQILKFIKLKFYNSNINKILIFQDKLVKQLKIKINNKSNNNNKLLIILIKKKMTKKNYSNPNLF